MKAMFERQTNEHESRPSVYVSECRLLEHVTRSREAREFHFALLKAYA